MEKRGQHNVLATVLIVFIAIVVVVIVFNIVKPLVSEKAGGIGAGFESYLKLLFGGENESVGEAVGGIAGTTTIQGITLNAINIDSCQGLNQSNTIYYLTRNLSGAEVTNKCINIKTSNIILDCQGHSIINSGLTGSAIYTDKENTTIQNCSISVGGDGIYLANGANNAYLLNNVLNNNDIGIYLANGANNAFILNSVLNNNKNGIEARYVENTVVENNIVNNNKGLGIYFISKGIYWDCNPKSTKNIIKGNTVNNNRLYGIFIYGDDNLISKNTVNGNMYGITSHGENNIFDDNIILNNGRNGIAILAGLASFLTDAGCKDKIQYLDNNKIIGNKVCNNSQESVGDYVDIGVSNSKQISEFDNQCNRTSYGTCLSCVDNITITRIINEIIPDVFEVNLNINNYYTNLNTFGISEYFPGGWQVTYASDNSVIRQDRIEWLFNENTGLSVRSKQVSYELFRTNSNNTFKGYWYVKSFNGTIGGTQSV